MLCVALKFRRACGRIDGGLWEDRGISRRVRIEGEAFLRFFVCRDEGEDVVVIMDEIVTSVFADELAVKSTRATSGLAWLASWNTIRFRQAR